MYVCMYVCMYTHAYLHVYIHECVYIYICIHMYTYVCTYAANPEPRNISSLFLRGLVVLMVSRSWIMAVTAVTHVTGFSVSYVCRMDGPIFVPRVLIRTRK